MKTPYEKLGLDKDATQKDIKKSYRKLAMSHHPDRGGDEDEFKEITLAYELLSDAERKEKFDRTGEQEKQDSLEDQAMQLIAVIFSQLIDAAEFNGNYVAEVKQQLKHLKVKAERSVVSLNRNLNRLVSTLGRVQVEGTDHNIFASIINTKIEQIENAVKTENDRLSLLELSRGILDKYTDSKAETEIHRSPFSSGTGGILDMLRNTGI